MMRKLCKCFQEADVFDCEEIAVDAKAVPVFCYGPSSPPQEQQFDQKEQQQDTTSKTMKGIEVQESNSHSANERRNFMAIVRGGRFIEEGGRKNDPPAAAPPHNEPTVIEESHETEQDLGLLAAVLGNHTRFYLFVQVILWLINCLRGILLKCYFIK